MGGRRGLVVLGALLAALVVSACSNHKLISLPDPGPGPVTTTTEPFPDYSGALLAPVPGRTTTTLATGPGGAAIGGSVVGPDGPVAGATVRLERLVGDRSANVDVGTQPDGTFAVPNLLGGRWRVRAWRAPDLALTTPVVFFMAASDQKQLNLALSRYTGTNVTSAIAPAPPIVGDAANLVIEVTTQQVDAQGVVRATPLGGASVQLAGSGSWAIKGSATQVTEADGTARWQVVCGSAGKQPLFVVVNSASSFPLDVPPCQDRPAETTTTSTLPTTSSTGTTSTTSRGGR